MKHLMGDPLRTYEESVKRAQSDIIALIVFNALNALFFILRLDITFLIGGGLQALSFIFSENPWYTLIPTGILILGYYWAYRQTKKKDPAGFVIASILFMLDTLVFLGLVAVAAVVSEAGDVRAVAIVVPVVIRVLVMIPLFRGIKSMKAYNEELKRRFAEIDEENALNASDDGIERVETE